MLDIETKTVRSEYQEYLSFGWELAETTKEHSGRSIHTNYVLARKKGMLNHDLLVKLEREYFDLKEKKKYYDDIDGLMLFLLCLILLIPGIIYLVYKINQKNRIEDYNQNIQSQMNAIVAQAKSLLK